MLPPITLPAGPATPRTDPTDTARLRAVAEKLEAQFLAEMLKAAGLGEQTGSFGGGTGEAQFASFLRNAQAEEMARGGGLGLAEHIFEALKERMDDTG